MDKKPVYCRIAYCERCAKDGRPFVNGIFVTVGSHQKPIIRRSLVNRPKGFVPHLINFSEVVVGGEHNGMIQVTQCCAMHECGVNLTRRDDEMWDIEILEAHYVYLKPNEWVALKDKWKRPTFYELDNEQS